MAAPGDSPHEYVWHPKVACRTLDGTAFVLLGDRMVSLNGVGTHIWAQLEAGATVDKIAQNISDEFDVTFDIAVQDATTFVESLIAREFLVSRPATG